MDLETFEKLNKAIIVATTAHEGQFRKGTKVPYIIHPYAAALTVMKFGGDTETIQAALLHDILEDVSAEVYSEQDMRRDFGDTVTEAVKAVSEIKKIDGEERPWTERKASYINRLVTADNARAFMVSAADKIHNMTSILEDYEVIGEELWMKFNGTKELEKKYYRDCYEVSKDKIPAEMAKLYLDCVEKIEAL